MVQCLSCFGAHSKTTVFHVTKYTGPRTTPKFGIWYLQNPNAINELRFVIASPTVRPDMQRRANTEILNDIAAPFTSAILVALVSDMCPLSFPIKHNPLVDLLTSHNTSTPAFPLP